MPKVAAHMHSIGSKTQDISPSSVSFSFLCFSLLSVHVFECVCILKHSSFHTLTTEKCKESEVGSEDKEFGDSLCACVCACLGALYVPSDDWSLLFW